MPARGFRLSSSSVSRNLSMVSPLWLYFSWWPLFCQLASYPDHPLTFMCEAKHLELVFWLRGSLFFLQFLFFSLFFSLTSYIFQSIFLFLSVFRDSFFSFLYWFLPQISFFYTSQATPFHITACTYYLSIDRPANRSLSCSPTSGSFSEASSKE